MRFRYGIRGLLVTLALVAAFFPFQDLYEHWFRSSYSGYHVHQSLGEYVSDGDPFNYVSSLFDRSEPRTKEWVDKYAPVLANRKSTFADYKDGDEYHAFFVNGGNVHALFQFRNGLVVNHLNKLYQSPYSSVRHPNDHVPSLLFRLGAIPLYLVVVSSVGLIALTIRRLVTSRPPDAT